MMRKLILAVALVFATQIGSAQVTPQHKNEAVTYVKSLGISQQIDLAKQQLAANIEEGKKEDLFKELDSAVEDIENKFGDLFATYYSEAEIKKVTAEGPGAQLPELPEEKAKEFGEKIQLLNQNFNNTVMGIATKYMPAEE